MTHKTITLSRELAERAMDAIEQVGYQDKFIDYTFVRAVKQEMRAALAEPVPPAGGDVQRFDMDPFCGSLEKAEDGAWVYHDDHCARVARLQAEVERLKDSLDDACQMIIQNGRRANALQAELAACQQQLTKARELLIKYPGQTNSIYEKAWVRERNTFLSNQSAPADKECSHRFMSLADDPRRCADCDAVETHDEPVVRLELVRSGASEGLHIRVWENLGNLWPGVHMLYLGPPEQPAPVAVVMPERLQQVLKFLDGSENLDGHWFGEPHPSGRSYWWRTELRKALEETNLFAKPE